VHDLAVGDIHLAGPNTKFSTAHLWADGSDFKPINGPCQPTNGFFCKKKAARVGGSFLEEETYEIDSIAINLYLSYSVRVAGSEKVELDTLRLTVAPIWSFLAS
jgi:hypothetical protein